ncbi:MAG: arginine--tRNA ligase [Acidimicrobiia bacterium]|nr:arginine--tRNA ligase [Acidimicrobiia bacterium]
MVEPVLTLLSARVRAAVAAAFGPGVTAPEPLVLPAANPRHGDYSCSAALALARVLREPPPVLAQRLAEALEVADACDEPEVAGGFVNLRLRAPWLAQRVAVTVGDRRLGLAPAARPDRIVIDYSPPNVAKEMHVGHLRSTIIGDALGNLASFAGHDVERVSHIGDWGTQFGMLIAHLEEVQPDDPSAAGAHIEDVEAFYRSANARFTEDEEFRQRARRRVVELQAGEPRARAAWTAMVELSHDGNEVVYGRLGVHALVERGESFYQPFLAPMVADLEAAGLVVVDDGAKCVFVDGFTNREGEPLPLIVEKADGGYNYATTDLAALRWRIEQGATRILYVVAADQAQHLAMVFAVARRAGWVPPTVEVAHVPFGLVQGEGGKRLRTRAGGTVRLVELLDEAVARARDFLLGRADERGLPPPEDVDRVARVVGIGALKYADLSQNRISNYVFSYGRMLSLKGNTAPYLQYAYARIRSILGDGGWGEGPPGPVEVVLDAPEELALARRLAEVGDVMDRVLADYGPNHLCAYLYELSSAYNAFYEHCPVLRSEEPARSSRHALCSLTASTLELGLGLLGIEVLERI